MVNDMGKRDLIYILSPSYSGSTLLTMLLAEHQRIATIGELKATSMGDLKQYQCSCGQPILECDFWKTLRVEMSERGSKLDLEDFHTHFAGNKKYISRILLSQIRAPFFELLRSIAIQAIPGLRKEYLSIMKKNKQMIDAICDIEKRSHFLDGSKDPQRLLYFDRSGNWNIKLIKMYRDGRAQSNSNRKKKANKMDYLSSVKEWRKTVKQMERVTNYASIKDVYTLRYEDLCSSPGKYMDELWDYIGIERIERNWSELDINKQGNHILGNNMRTKDKLRVSLDEGWRSDVTKEELDIFRKVAGDMNASLGYRT